MLNNRKTESIKKNTNPQEINISGEAYPKKKKSSHTPKLNKPAKHNYQRKTISDFSNAPEDNGIFIQVKTNKYYKLVSAFLAIFVTGLVILFLINSVNVYLRGMEAKDAIEASAYKGFSQLLEGSASTTKVRFTEAMESFESALENFEDAEENLWFIATDHTIYAQQSTLASSAQAILRAGKYFAKAGEYFTETIEELNKIPLYIVAKNEAGTTNTPDEDVTDFLKKAIDKAGLALIETRAANLELEKINKDMLPADLQGRFEYAKGKIAQIIKTLESIEEHFPAMLKLLGEKHQHRILVLLQNNAEARPTGGFIGSYAIVDLNDGLIENVKVEDVYHLDDLYAEIVEAPEYLAKYSPNFLFRNSNYSPDFSYSGKNAAWMLQKEGGPSVDTVIAINQSLLKEFLEITGPLKIGDLSGKISSENYEAVLTYIIEAKIWGKEDPKHVLKILISEFQKEIMKKENVASIMSILVKAAQEKMIMAYSKDSLVESFFDTLGISGRVPKTPENEDYLSVIHVTMGGTKTEPLMEESILHDTQLEEDGTIIDEVTITRTHTFDRKHQARWNQQWDDFGIDHSEVPGYVVDILGRGTNYVNTRIIVPEGSKLIEVKGISMDDVKVGYDKDLEKTYFLTEMRTPPLNTTSITLKYELPNKLDFDPVDTYRLTVQKQPGTRGKVFTKTLTANYPYSYFPADIQVISVNQLQYATDLSVDRFFSALVGE